MRRSFPHRLALLDEALARRPRAGLVCEFGVYTGQTLNHLARAVAPELVHGFDSFRGLPEAWRAGFEAGTFALRDLPVVEGNARLHVGLFNETIPPFLVENSGPLSLLHVDCDLYSSTVSVLGGCADRFAVGTVVVFDEYQNYLGWEQGEARAWGQFVELRGVAYEVLGEVPSDQQLAVVITALK